jgi:hypothetical protein
MTRTTVTPISVVGRGMSNAFLVRGSKAVPQMGTRAEGGRAVRGGRAQDTAAILGAAIAQANQGAHIPLNGAAVLRAALAGGQGTVNGS